MIQTANRIKHQEMFEKAFSPANGLVLCTKYLWMKGRYATSTYLVPRITCTVMQYFAWHVIRVMGNGSKQPIQYCISVSSQGQKSCSPETMKTQKIINFILYINAQLISLNITIMLSIYQLHQNVGTSSPKPYNCDWW